MLRDRRICCPLLLPLAAALRGFIDKARLLMVIYILHVVVYDDDDMNAFEQSFDRFSVFGVNKSVR